LLNYAQDFAVNWTKVTGVQWPQIWMSNCPQEWLRSPRLLHFQCGGSERCTDCLGKHSMQKRSQPEGFFKTDTMVLQQI